MSDAVIYKIINLINGKFYIGSTNDAKNRFRKHRKLLNEQRHHCPHLQAAWSLYGEENFVFKIVELIEDQRALASLEQEWLYEHHGTDQCYNYAKYTDNSNRGVALSEKHKSAISDALKRRYTTHPHPMTGKTHKTESRQLMSQNRRGKPVSEETREKLRQANLGKKYSEETKAKLSAMRKGKERSESHAAKYNKQIIEVTTGEVFPSLKAVKERFGMSPGMMAKALAADRPLTRGKNAGLHFRYLARSMN